MPFIKKDRRVLIALGQMDEKELEPGDRCYIYYKHMVERWRAEPRWTTANEIRREIELVPVINTDPGNNTTARELAWQVFFQLYVMPYELKKRQENGDI